MLEHIGDLLGRGADPARSVSRGQAIQRSHAYWSPVALKLSPTPSEHE